MFASVYSGVVARNRVGTIERVDPELFEARPAHRFGVAINAPDIRRAIVAGVHFQLRIGAKAVELHSAPAHAAAAGGVSQEREIDWVLDRGEHNVLLEVPGSYYVRRV